MAASLLLVGCGDSATGAEAKAAAEHKTESTMKCGEGKCGGDKKSATTEAKEATATVVEKTKEAVTEAKEAATKAVEKTKEVVAEKASEAKEAATKAVESVKEKAASAVDSAKAAATSAASAAVAAVTESGPDGKALFAKCAGCHGADGKTKAMGKSAVLAGQSAADLESKITAYKAGTRNEAGMGALMKGQVASLSDADIKAIATYVSGL